MSFKKAVTLSLAICVTAFSFAQTTAQEYYAKAVEADASNNYIRAQEMLFHALQLNVKYDSAICLNGMIYYKLGNFDLAIKQMDKVLSSQPNYFEAFYTRGIAKAALEDYFGAIKDFNKAVQLNQTNPKLYYNMALTKAHLDDFAHAIDDLDKAISLKNDYVQAYYSRGYWKDVSGDYEGAVADYKKVIELDSSYREAYMGLATCLYQHGEKEKACELLNQAGDKGSFMAEELINKFCK